MTPDEYNNLKRLYMLACDELERMDRSKSVEYFEALRRFVDECEDHGLNKVIPNN